MVGASLPLNTDQLSLSLICRSRIASLAGRTDPIGALFISSPLSSEQGIVNQRRTSFSLVCRQSMTSYDLPTYLDKGQMASSQGYSANHGQIQASRQSVSESHEQSGLSIAPNLRNLRQTMTIQGQSRQFMTRSSSQEDGSHTPFDKSRPWAAQINFRMPSSPRIQMQISQQFMPDHLGQPMFRQAASPQLVNLVSTKSQV